MRTLATSKIVQATNSGRFRQMTGFFRSTTTRFSFTITLLTYPGEATFVFSRFSLLTRSHSIRFLIDSAICRGSSNGYFFQ